MRTLTLILALAALAPASAVSQETWELMGYAIMDDGDSAMVRLEIDLGEVPEVRLARWGESPLEFERVAIPLDTAAMTFEWPGREFSACSLERSAESTWVGACTGGAADASRAVAFGGRFTPDLGIDVRPTGEDIEIVERALALLAGPDDWNPSGARVCDDDGTAEGLSLFCALYVASLETTGEYVHRRPAMQAVRYTIVMNRLLENQPLRPGTRTIHPLQDYNNQGGTTHSDILAVLRRSKSRVVRLVWKDRVAMALGFGVVRPRAYYVDGLVGLLVVCGAFLALCAARLVRRRSEGGAR